jgi:Tfp pilus assembly protein PilW
MKRRGISLAELLASMIAFLLALTAAISLQLTGSKSLNRIQSDLSVSTPSAQAMRRVSETLRSAMSITLSSDGKTITYILPKLTTTNDPVTGEKELVYPLVSDGVTRSFVVSGTNLVSNPGGRVLVRNISSTDPQVGSTQYNQTYNPFQSTTIGSRRAITITIICKEIANGKTRYARMKSTVLIQNS